MAVTKLAEQSECIHDLNWTNKYKLAITHRVQDEAAVR